jgi:Domain of unknown function (DUF1963)
MRRTDISAELWDAYRAIIRRLDIAQFEDAILAATVPAIELQSVHDPLLRLPADTLRTKAGGFPDLPPELSWPEVYGELIPFIAQVDLGELPQLATSRLPESGILYFFNWCTNKACERPCRVLYSEVPLAELSVRRVDESRILRDWQDVRVYDEQRTAAARVSLTFSTPLATKIAVSQGALSRDTISEPMGIFDDFWTEAWWELEAHLNTKSLVVSPSRWGMLLGYNSEHQTLMPDVEPYDGGFRDGDHTLLNLLELPSIDNMRWSDAGYLSFFIREDELDCGEFDAAFSRVMST